MSRVLVISAPFSGHVNPPLPLVAELVSRGHDVGFINTQKWKNKIEDVGAKFIPYSDFPENLSQLQELKRCFLGAYNAALLLQEHYDLLIYDSFLYHGKSIADKLGIPSIRLMLTPPWNDKAITESKKDPKRRKLYNKAMREYGILDKFALSKKAKIQMGIKNKNLISAVLYDTAELNIVYVAEAFQPFRDTFDERFIFSIPEIENTRKIDINIPYGEMKAPIIYISLGSMIKSKAFLRKCIKAFGNKEMTIILSCGGLDPGKLGNLPDNIYAYSFVPQLEVLQHVDLFFTHGGMNSVNEAIFYGVPMLVKPVINDQPVNALRVEELQIGKQITGLTFLCSAKKIYMKTMEVLNDSFIKANAKKIMNKARTDIGVSGVADKVEKVLQKYKLTQS